MAREVLIVGEKDLRAGLALDLQTVATVERAFAALDRGDAVMPPILSMEIEQARGEVDVKTAYLPGFEGFAIKVSPGFFDNPKLGLPSLNGLMMLFSAQTGLLQGVFLDNGFLTDIRTAAAGAVAAKHLAPKKVATAGVLGAGMQARLQIRAAHLVRPMEEVLVWARDLAKAEACASDLSKSLGIKVRVESDPARLVAQSQLVVTTTPAREPILKADWLHPGLHITAMGSDQSGKNEIDPKALVAADLYVCDRVSQCELLGELRSAVQAGLWQSGAPPELGAFVSGKHAGREREQDITICDLTGTGAQDTAIANFAYAFCRDRGIGTVMET